MRALLVAGLLLALAVLPPPAAEGQATVRINWTATAGTMSGLWLAYEEGIFRKNGVNAELIHVSSSSRAIQAMLAGEIACSPLDVVNVVEANLKGEFKGYLESIPWVSRKELETILAEVREREPKAKGARPEDFFDARYLQALEAEGLFRKLWGR